MHMYIGHLFSLLIYVAVIVSVILAYCDLSHVVMRRDLSIIIRIFLITLLAQAATFITLQIEWVWMDYNEVVGDLTAYAWLAFDYFNGLALLSFVTAVRIFLGWRFKAGCESSFKYRRRIDDL